MWPAADRSAGGTEPARSWYWLGRRVQPPRARSSRRKTVPTRMTTASGGRPSPRKLAARRNLEVPGGGGPPKLTADCQCSGADSTGTGAEVGAATLVGGGCWSEWGADGVEVADGLGVGADQAGLGIGQ